MLRIGRIPYINCYPVYGAIDRGLVPLDAELVNGVPTALNERMSRGDLDLSVVSAVEYARDAERYLLLPELAISCNGPVQSVMLFSKRPAEQLSREQVIVSRSSMTSVALLELLFAHVWHAKPEFVPGDAEMDDIARFNGEAHEARLVIGDAALRLHHVTAQQRVDTVGGMQDVTQGSASDSPWPQFYPYRYDLGETWKQWTGLPFVFAVWVAQRTTPVHESMAAHASLLASRDWGLANLPMLAEQAAQSTGVGADRCLDYLSGLDYRLSYPHLAGLTEFFRRLVVAGRVPDGSLAFLPAA